MKPACKLVLLLLPLLLLTGLLPVSAEDLPEQLTYTFTDDAPEVNAQEIFLSVYDGEYDIRIEGTRASWDFFYENIFRSTDKWRTFSASVGVVPAAESALEPAIVTALSGAAAYYIDFRDGDLYPGTAVVTVALADIADLTAAYLLYEVEPDGTLRAIADGLSLGTDGMLSLTLTEAHDFLLVTAAEETAAALSAYAYVPDYEVEDGFFAGANIGWIVFFIVLGLLLVCGAVYLITVRVIKKKRKAAKQLPSKKK
ncbi:MAG: hypothetical protein IJ302_07220 [Clostridia bacterium]|nr:hypothetical protein [Clostridia bacterium]